LRIYAHSQSLCGRVANLACLEIKSQKKIWLLAYFQSDRLGSGTTLSKLHIHYKSLATRVYYHAGCAEYCKKFTVALKMIYAIDKKQMHDSVITGKEYASKDWTCVISMFLTSFNVYFVCSCACFMCICIKPAIRIFLDKVWLSLVKTGWQPCCVVSKIRSSKPRCATAGPAAHLCSTICIRRHISAASFCSCKLL